MHRSFDMPIDRFLKVSNPHFYRAGAPGESEEAFSTRCAQELEDLILREGPDTIAAFFAEPVMTSAGVILPPAGYFEKIQAVLKRHDVLFVADEVVCGFGRTGSYWGCDTFGIVPDILTCAKALTSAYFPLSATLISERLYQGIKQGGDEIGVFAHGYTYGGHPVGAAVALETLRIYDETDIVSRVRTRAPQFQRRLAALRDHPLVGEARGVGLCGAIELVHHKESRTSFSTETNAAIRLVAFARSRGLIVRPIGPAVAFAPPLIITEAEVDMLFDCIEGALDELSRDLAGDKYMRRRSFVAAGLAIPVVSGSVLAQPRSPQSTLRFVPQVGLTFLDPIFNIAAVTNYHAFYVFDMLYGLDSQLRPQPQMAKGHTIEDDGHTWVIRLRDGLMFHDGTVVRAVDVVASLKRWAAKDAFGQSVALAVEEWLAPDDYTVKVRLKQPFPLLADALAKPFASPAVIMPERLARTDPATQVTEMVGSGPYRFVASGFDPGNKAVYARFNEYVPREEPPDWFAGGKRAVFDRIEWNAIPDAGTAAAALQAGEIDWWEDVPEDLVPLLQRNPRVKLQASDPTGLVPVLRFNCTIPPFDKPELRRAVLQAVNQQDFMAAMVGGDSGQARSCFSMFPCNTPYGALPVASGMSNTPDLDTSRAAVRHAGYAGEPVVILSPGDFPELSALSEVAFSLLKELGFKVELAVSDWDSLLKRRASREPVERGGWSLYASYWSGLAISNPAGNALIRGQGKAGWAGWYESAEMETTFQDWLSAPDEAARNDAVERMEQIAFRDAPTIPLGQVFSRTGFRTSIEGVMVAPAPLPWNVRPA